MDRTDQKHNTQRKNQRDSCLIPRVLSQQSIRAQLEFSKGAHWEGELEGLSTTGAWIYFGGYLLETYPTTQQIVALSTTESEYISTKDVAHALGICDVLAECDMTLKMKGKNGTGQLGVQRPRDVELAACITWMRDFRGCVGRRRGSLVSAFEPAWRTQRGRPGVEDERFDFTFDRNTPSTTIEFIELELTDGGSKFPRC